MIAIAKKRSPKKLLIAICAAIIIILGAATTYVYALNGNIFGWTKTSTNTTSSQPSTSNQNPTDPANSSSETKTGSNGSDQPSSPQTVEGSTKKSVESVITAAAQNGSTLQIRSIIYLVTDTGTCTLTLAKSGSNTVTKTAVVQSLPSSSTCAGFDVPVSELSNGQWTVVVSFENDSYTSSATKTVGIN